MAKSKRPYADIPDTQLLPHQTFEIAKWYEKRARRAQAEGLRIAEHAYQKFGDAFLEEVKDTLEVGPDGKLRHIDPVRIPEPDDN